MLGCDLHCSYCQNWVTSQALRDPAAVVGPMCITPAELGTRYFNSTHVIRLDYVYAGNLPGMVAQNLHTLLANAPRSFGRVEFFFEVGETLQEFVEGCGCIGEFNEVVVCLVYGSSRSNPPEVRTGQRKTGSCDV